MCFNCTLGEGQRQVEVMETMNQNIFKSTDSEVQVSGWTMATIKQVGFYYIFTAEQGWGQKMTMITSAIKLKSHS